MVGLRVVDDGPEGAVGELRERRGRLLEPEQALRRHHDERPRARVERLAAQQVEVLRGGRAVRDPDVLLRGELEEPLEAGARVLRPVALVAVREQQRQPRGLTPFRQARDEELVEHDLRAVHEVAELRLPEHERLGRRDRVAVLEPERGVLRERRVVDLEGRVGLVEALHRREALARLGVVEDEVPVRERSALGVLAGQPDRDPLDEQAREREPLRVAPVDAAVVERLEALVELRLQLRVHGEAVGDAQRAPPVSARSRSAATAVTTSLPVVAGSRSPSARARAAATPSAARAPPSARRRPRRRSARPPRR